MHALKTYSMGSAPFISQDPMLAINSGFYNPLAKERIFHHIPFRDHVKFSDEFIFHTKSISWPDSGGTVPALSHVFNYPPLYYGPVFLLGQSATEVFELSPYDSFFAYRIASCFLVAALWALAYGYLCRATEMHDSIFLVIMLNPMLAYISSSINPDAMVCPVCFFLMICTYELFFHRAPKRTVFCILLLCAACFIKPSCLLLFPTIAVTTAILCFAPSAQSPVRAAGIVCGVSLIVVQGLYYYWSNPVAYIHEGIQPITTTLSHYFSESVIGDRGSWIVASYWGILGWLDYELPKPFYHVLNALFLLNLAGCIVSGHAWFSKNITWYSFVFALVFSGGMFALEYYLLPRFGYVLQGRYFLPVSLGFAIVVSHNYRSLRYLLICCLLVFNCAFFVKTVDRYYGGDWSLAWRALPFTAPKHLPASVLHYQP